MKKSIPRSSQSHAGPGQRASKGPVRMPSMGGPSQGERSSIRRTSATQSAIPILRGRSSSVDRLSRNVVDLSTKKHSRRSRSSASARASPLSGQRNPQTPSYSGSSYRSRSAERPVRFANIAASKRAETRPIGDKMFQLKAMQRVSTFFQLQTADIAALCPPPNCKSIMIKSFVDMMQFLLQQFFPGTKIVMGYYITEIPAYMKKLGYPGNLTTSWLKTANAPHAWPHVVAALSWLVDLLSYEDYSTDDGFKKYFVRRVDDIVDCKAFLEYAMDSFGPWNYQHDDVCEQMDQRFIAQMRSEHVNMDDIHAMRAEVAALKQSLDDPEERAAIAKEKALEDEFQMLMKRKKNLQDNTITVNESTAKLHNELEQLMWQNVELDKQNTHLDVQRDELDHVIASQELSVQEAQEVKEKIIEMEVKYQQLDTYSQNIVKMVYSLEVQMASKQKKLNNMCVEYNSNILADFGEDKDRLLVEIDFYNDALADQWREVDAAIDDAMSKMRQELKRLKKEAKKRCRDNDNFNLKLREQREERNRTQQALREAKARLQKVKEEAHAEEEALKKHYDFTKSEMEQLKKKMPDVEGADKQLVIDQERVSRHKKEITFIQEKGKEFIIRLRKRLDDRLAIQKKKLEDYIDEVAKVIDGTHPSLIQ